MRLTRLSLVAPLAVLLAAGAPPTRAEAQDPVMTVADRAPRFYVASTPKPVPVDASRMPVLRQRISVDFNGMRLGDALEVITHESGLRLMYSWTTVPVDRVVTLKAENITVAGALSEVLFDAGVDVLFERDGQAAIVKRPAPPVVGTITGIVTEAATGQPIPQAQVSVVGTSLRHATGQDGRYTIAGVPTGQHTVTVRRLGYDPMSQDITVRDGESATLDFALIRVPTRLAEVVTTVTGGQRRLEMGTTIASINADSLMQIAPVMNMNDLLQARAPGVFSLPEGSSTGRASRIRIRGLNSALLSNDPIMVVDGARIEAGGASRTIVLPTAAGAGGFTGRLSDLDPDEIASIEIAKGPAAATLYGTDAANGVIVITTKHGHAGRTRWSAFTEQGIVSQRLDYADHFPDGYYAFGRNSTTNAQQRCTLLQRAASTCVADSLTSFNTFTNGDTKPYKDGGRHQYGLQLSGGREGGATFFLNGNVENETGTTFMPAVDQNFIRTQQRREVPDWQVRPNAVERLNVRANVSSPMGSRGSVALSTAFTGSTSRQMPSLPDGQLGYRDVNDGWVAAGNPLFRPAYAFAPRSEDVVRRFTGSLSNTYSPLDWLTMRGTLGVDLSTNSYGVLIRRGEIPAVSTGARQSADLSVSLYSLDLGATGTRALSPTLSSKTSVGLQYNRRSQRGAYVQVTNLPLGGETVAGGTVAFGPLEATLTTAVGGGYVEQVFGHHDRLFLTGGLRFDGASTFGQDYSLAVYPKIGASWVVTDGEVGMRIPGVNSLRLRTAYGRSGVQPGPTDALARVTVATGVTVAGTAAGPIGFLVAGNPDLKPERISEFEGGFDLQLWESRARLELTAYQRTSDDALINRPNALSVGGSRIENLGAVRNRGVELLAAADLLQTRTVHAGFSATGTLNKNRLLRLGEGVALRNSLAILAQQEVGYPIFGLWGFALESFADANSNGIIEPTEVVTSTETRFVGPNFPTREATFAPYLATAGNAVRLMGLVQYRGGFYRNAGLRFQGCSIGLDFCRASNDISTPLSEQALAIAVANLRRVGPTIEDASYVVFRELSLSISVAQRVASLVKASSGHVVFAGRNIGALWKASLAPIEAATNSVDGVSQSSQSSATGPATYWLARVNLIY